MQLACIPPAISSNFVSYDATLLQVRILAVYCIIVWNTMTMIWTTFTKCIIKTVEDTKTGESAQPLETVAAQDSHESD
jgi:hypothetical protein